VKADAPNPMLAAEKVKKKVTAHRAGGRVFQDASGPEHILMLRLPSFQLFSGPSRQWQCPVVLRFEQFMDFIIYN
jgi:hypothetical protein